MRKDGLTAVVHRGRCTVVHCHFPSLCPLFPPHPHPACSYLHLHICHLDWCWRFCKGQPPLVSVQSVNWVWADTNATDFTSSVEQLLLQVHVYLPLSLTTDMPTSSAFAGNGPCKLLLSFENVKQVAIEVLVRACLVSAVGLDPLECHMLITKSFALRAPLPDFSCRPRDCPHLDKGHVLPLLTILKHLIH